MDETITRLLHRSSEHGNILTTSIRLAAAARFRLHDFKCRGYILDHSLHHWQLGDVFQRSAFQMSSPVQFLDNPGRNGVQIAPVPGLASLRVNATGGGEQSLHPLFYGPLFPLWIAVEVGSTRDAGLPFHFLVACCVNRGILSPRFQHTGFTSSLLELFLRRVLLASLTAVSLRCTARRFRSAV